MATASEVLKQKAIAAGGAIIITNYNYDSTTAKADPGAGTFRLDSVTMGSVTEMYIDTLDNAGVDMTAWISGLADGIHLRMGQSDDAAAGALFVVGGTPVDETGYYTVPLTHVADGTSGLTNGKTYGFQFEGGGSGGGGGGGTETILATKELGKVSLVANQSTITFDNIDQTYERIYIKFKAKTDNAGATDVIQIEFNDDSTLGNYWNQLFYGENSASVNVDVGDFRIAQITGNTAISFSTGTIEIDDYTSGDDKVAVGRFTGKKNATDVIVGMIGQGYTTSNAITKIDLTPKNGTNFLSGSEFILYGEKKITLGGSGGGVVEEFRAYGGAGFATASAWPYFTTTEVNTISTYGTITDCVIYISATLLLNETASWGFSLNEVGGDKNVAWSSLTAGTGLRGVSSPVAGWFSTTSDSVKLSDGDFVKIHVQSGKTFAASDRNGISILVSPA
jgi:hypothetical protein